jgi:hypothetical protein
MNLRRCGVVSPGTSLAVTGSTTSTMQSYTTANTVYGAKPFAPQARQPMVSSQDQFIECEAVEGNNLVSTQQQFYERGRFARQEIHPANTIIGAGHSHFRRVLEPDGRSAGVAELLSEQLSLYIEADPF